jgi:hypothetical protein
MSTNATHLEREFAGTLTRLLSLRDVDCRKQGAARRVRTFARHFAVDLGGDLSAAEQQLVQRTSVLAALLEDREARILSGEKISIGDYVAMISVQKQLLLALGIKRVPRDVSALSEYLAQQRDDVVEAAE